MLHIRGPYILGGASLHSLFHSFNKQLPISSVTLKCKEPHRQLNYNRNRNCLDSVKITTSLSFWRQIIIGEPSICETQFKTDVIPALLPSMGERQKSLTKQKDQRLYTEENKIGI